MNESAARNEQRGTRTAVKSKESTQHQTESTHLEATGPFVSKPGIDSAVAVAVPVAAALAAAVAVAAVAIAARNNRFRSQHPRLHLRRTYGPSPGPGLLASASTRLPT